MAHSMIRKVCIVTGAAGTLGTELCRAYADNYDLVAVHHRTPLMVPSQNGQYVDPLQPTAELDENRRRVFAIQANLEDDSDLSRIVKATLDQYGRIDIVVNAAVRSVWSPILQGRRLLDSVEAQFRLNVAVPLKLTALVAREFWSRRARENAAVNRSVINISSTAGLHVYPGQGQSVYAATKAALNQLTLHMAAELAPIGVRVNAVAPNAFPRIVPTARVCWAVHQFASGATTGQIFVVDREREYFL